MFPPSCPGLGPNRHPESMRGAAGAALSCNFVGSWWFCGYFLLFDFRSIVFHDILWCCYFDDRCYLIWCQIHFWSFWKAYISVSGCSDDTVGGNPDVNQWGAGVVFKAELPQRWRWVFLVSSGSRKLSDSFGGVFPPFELEDFSLNPTCSVGRCLPHIPSLVASGQLNTIPSSPEKAWLVP